MTKLVSLSNTAYKTLLKMKGKDMSFSDAVLKLVNMTERKRDFLRYAGVLKPQSTGLEKFKKQIEKDRKRNTEPV